MPWRDRAREALAPVAAARAARSGDAKVPWDDWLELDTHTVRTATRCPAMLAAPGSPFEETARTARRRLALALLRVLRDDPTLDPFGALRRVVDDGDADDPWFGLPAWVADLPPGSRTAVAAEAVTLATMVVDWLHPAPLGAVEVEGPRAVYRWEVPGVTVRVSGRAELATGRPSRGNRALLVVSSVGPDDEAGEWEAAHVALAHTLTTGASPARVRVVHLASGWDRNLAVDDDLLDGALERASGALAARLAARFGPPAAPEPGPWCRRCPRVEADCAAGAAWSVAAPRRLGGLPQPTPEPS